MAGSVNKVIVIGNLGAAPELKYLPSGQAVAELRIACNDSYTDKQGQKVERTEWVRVQVWGKTAENCAKYLQKGRQVYVEGSLRTESWDDKTTGEKKYATRVNALQVVFLGGGGPGEAGAGAGGGGGGGGGAPRPTGAPSGGGGYGGGGGGAGAPQRGGPPSQDAPPDFGSGTDDDIPF